MLPLAIRYGMPTNEFWHGDTRLLGIYQREYIRNKHYEAWLQGQFNTTAFSVALANAFAKKGSKPVEYPAWRDPIPNHTITKERQEEKFRKSQVSQNLWLHNMINK